MESGVSVVHSTNKCTNKCTKALFQGNQDIKYAPLSRIFWSEAGFVFNY